MSVPTVAPIALGVATWSVPWRLQGEEGVGRCLAEWPPKCHLATARGIGYCSGMDPTPHAKLPGKAGIVLHYAAILVAIVVAREMKGSRLGLYGAVALVLGSMAVVEIILSRKAYTDNDLKNMEIVREQMEDRGLLRFAREHHFGDS